MTAKELEIYKMSEAERQKWNEIKQTVKMYCKRVMIPGFMSERIENILREGMLYGQHVAGYCESEGYYYIEYGDRGMLYLKCLSIDSQDVCFYIMQQIAREAGQKIELNERDAEERKWLCTYHTKYDTRKKWFEYTLNVLLEIFGQEAVAPLIEEYTGYMNHWFKEKYWSYDTEIREFVEISVPGKLC